VPNLPRGRRGNLFELKQCSGLRLLDIRLPDAFAAPIAGRSSVRWARQLAGVHGSPLIGTIIKPSVGLGPDETAELVRVRRCRHRLHQGHELQADGPACPFDLRVRGGHAG